MSRCVGIQPMCFLKWKSGKILPSYESLLRLRFWIETLNKKGFSPPFDANVWFVEYLTHAFTRDAESMALNFNPKDEHQVCWNIDEIKRLKNLFKSWLYIYLTLTDQTNAAFALELGFQNHAMNGFLRQKFKLPTFPTLQKIHDHLSSIYVFDANVFFVPEKAITWLQKLIQIKKIRMPEEMISNAFFRIYDAV